MKKIAKMLMGLSLALGLGVIFGATTYAADAGLDSITISPVSAKVSLTPGTTTDGTLKVINSGSSELVFKVYATPFYVANNNYDNLQFSGGNNRTQISRWITFDQENYTLAAGETAQVVYHINVPESVPAGGQYAAIMAESTPTQTGEGISASSRVGMLVYSSVAGTTFEEGDIAGNKIDGWYKASPIKTTVSVKNSGNTDFAVNGTLKAYNIFGGEVYASETKAFQVLPETTRDVVLEWDSKGRVGIYTIKQSVQFLGFDETYSRLVLLMPVWLLVVLIVVVIAIIALVVVKLQGGSLKKVVKRAPAKKTVVKRGRK
jgi:hypothetical protein